MLCGAAVVAGLASETLAGETRRDRLPKRIKPITAPHGCQVKAAAKDRGDAPSEKITLTTGTHLKETTRKRGEITFGRNSVVVLDQATMQRSGAATLRDVLARQSTTW